MAELTEETAQELLSLLGEVVEALPALQVVREMYVRKTDADETFDLNKGTLSKSGKTVQQKGKRCAYVKIGDLEVYTKRGKK